MVDYTDGLCREKDGKPLKGAGEGRHHFYARVEAWTRAQEAPATTPESPDDLADED